MMVWRAATAVTLAATLVFAQDTPIRREGSHWVQVVAGTMNLPPDCRLRVDTRGPITLQGQPNSNRISYTIKKRVRAKSETEARALLSAATVQSNVRRGMATISLAQTRSRISAEMLLNATSELQAVTLATSAGDIQVYDISGTVQAETEGGLIQMDRIGSDVTAKTGGGEIHFGSIDGSIRCFSGGGRIQVDSAGKESWLETAGGDILVRDSGGPIHTSTGGGNILVQRAAAMVSARTSGGRIEVSQASGIVLADNSGGSIQVGSAGGGVRVASAGGSIRLRGSSGSLRASTDVGSILAELMQGLPIQDSLLSTGAGDITVYIPSNLALTVKALNENGPAGRIISEFSEIMVRQAAEEARQSVLAEGVLNGGGPVLRLTSTGGTIYLKRQR